MQEDITYLGREKVLKSFGGDELATDVFCKKYAVCKDVDKNTKELLEFSLQDVKNRMVEEQVKVEHSLAIEKNEIIDLTVVRKEHLQVLKHFLPGGRILYALGNWMDKNG